jgi:hypothetical protein
LQHGHGGQCRAAHLLDVVSEPPMVHEIGQPEGVDLIGHVLTITGKVVDEQRALAY